MKALIKVSNSELSFRLKLNYNNVYARLRMILGKECCFFADLSTKSTGTTWYSDDDAEYSRMNEVAISEQKVMEAELGKLVGSIRKQLMSSAELAQYVDDILEVPDYSFIFYRKNDSGYKFVLTAWGCKYAHQNINDPNSGFIKRISKVAVDAPVVGENSDEIKIPKSDISVDIPETIKVGGSFENPRPEGMDIQKVQSLGENGLKESHDSQNNSNTSTTVESNNQTSNILENKEEEPQKQHVVLRVLDQNNSSVIGELVEVIIGGTENKQYTDDDGKVEIGNLEYGSVFHVRFPKSTSGQERAIEVEPKVEVYDTYIKKLVKYSPLLFVEDQNGNSVHNYNVKVVVNGQETTYNTGNDGVIQLPTLIDGQGFVVIDTLNYANTQDYTINQKDAKKPYKFKISRAIKNKVGITIINKNKKPIPNATVSLSIDDKPCQQTTDNNGRVEFPYDLFQEGDILVVLNIKGKGIVKSNLHFTNDTSEYTIQLQDIKPKPKFDYKWLALIPLFLLLGWGGYTLWNKLSYNKPSIAEMEKGVVMTLSLTSYWVELNLDEIYVAGKPLEKWYFHYDHNKQEVILPQDQPEALKDKPMGSWGTGFLISEDGLIATNRHVADPIPPEWVVKKLREQFQNYKGTYQKLSNNLSDTLRMPALYGISTLEQYNNLQSKLKNYQEMVDIFDKILNVGDFKVKSECRVSVAFTGTRVQTIDDFIPASLRISGDPGTLTENDVAIIQINKKSDIPDDTYIFEIPEKDPFDEEVPDDYSITVLGYNAGNGLQDMKLQKSIKPQAQHGKISNTSEKYRIGFDAPTIGGSSGSPVLNENHELVAVNNSGVGITQGFNYGVRIKYLKELVDNLKKTNNK